MSTQGLPLTGVRVVEMTHMVMGPTCGMILAQLGAEVIKVGPPSGDKTRSLGGMGTSFFPLFNRGKRSVVLDLAKPDDRETMDRLLASADVLWKTFAMDSWKSRGSVPTNCGAGIRISLSAGTRAFCPAPMSTALLSTRWCR